MLYSIKIKLMIIKTKDLISFILFAFLFCGCWNPTYQALKELENTTFENAPELITAKRAIKFIETSQLDSLKNMFPTEMANATKESIWEDIMTNGSKAINLYTMPPDSLVKISNTINLNNGSKQIVTKLSFPYYSKEMKSKKTYINLATSEGKLYGLNVGDYPFGMRIVEPKHSEPHLDNHSLSYESIKWFRIWYGSGFEKNDYGDRFGYYAVSGEKKTLKELNIEPELFQLFELINKTKPDSIDFKHLRDEAVGDPEYIYLRFKFDKTPYDKFGEFSIYHHLKDEPGKTESMSKYIIVKHSEKTRYLFLVDKNSKFSELLKKITYKIYDKYFERRWL